MHSLVYAVPPMAPTGLADIFPTTGADESHFNWTDNSTQEARVHRSSGRRTQAFTTGLTTFTTSQPELWCHVHDDTTSVEEHQVPGTG